MGRHYIVQQVLFSEIKKYSHTHKLAFRSIDFIFFHLESRAVHCRACLAAFGEEGYVKFQMAYLYGKCSTGERESEA